MYANLGEDRIPLDCGDVVMVVDMGNAHWWFGHSARFGNVL